MNNTINGTCMTGAYRNFLKNEGAAGGRRMKPESFQEEAVEKSAESRSVPQTQKTEAVSGRDMTMEEYKQYIHGRISQIPLHPSRMQESISIHISEAGFEAMKNDPEYEAWVLNDLQAGWAQPDRWSGICGGACSAIYYGASKEECHAQMWSAGYQNGSGKSLFESRAEDSFWERRAERRKQIEAQAEEWQEKRRIQEAAYEKAAYERTAYERAALERRMRMGG